jgi:hypothetical protein
VPAVIPLVALGDQDAGRLARFEDHDDLVGLGALEVGRHEVIAPPVRRVEKRGAPMPYACGDPVVKLSGDVAQEVARDALAVPVGVEEADDPLRLLKRLNEAVQEQPVETAVAELDTARMMLDKGVHDPSRVRSLAHGHLHRLHGRRAVLRDIKGAAEGCVLG